MTRDEVTGAGWSGRTPSVGRMTMTRDQAFREAFRLGGLARVPRYRWPVNGHVPPTPYRLYRTAREVVVALALA